MQTMSGILEGVRIIDMSPFLAGAYGTGLLASFGAEVILLEPVEGSFMRSLETFAPGLAALSSLVNHDKKNLALNLKTEKGREVFKRLVNRSDVVVETFRPGTMSELGLDYEQLVSVNPRLVYLSQTAYGQTGPRRNDVGYDAGVQATSGMQTLREHPEVAPPIFADIVSSVYGALAILTALWCRQATGRGQYIDLSMNDAMFSQNYLSHLRIAWEGMPKEVIDMSSYPPRCLLGCFRASDGYVVNCLLRQEQWAAAATVFEQKQLVEDKRFDNIISRALNDEAASCLIEEWTSAHPRDDILDAMTRVGAPCGKVLSREEVAEDPQLRSRGMLIELDDAELGTIRVPGVPFKMSETPAEMKTAAPRLGEHTVDILVSLLGYSKTEVADLKRQGVVGY
jgi:CoA:oxalate CoA-transferase